MLRNSLRVARKELSTFFASPVAYIFLGAFLLVTLFIFFWAESFFARNIADVRPLFEWMPVLLIFLVAALTMRMWSEERRMGTLEYLLTLPVTPLEYLLGKFIAALGLVALALVLTLPLPVTVSVIGQLDWGPVAGGYLAALFLGAAYIAIGLFLSARSDNQIVSLLGTVLVCGLFYLLGSNLLTGFFGTRAGEMLKLFGSGSRFASITRGVIDLRDLYYYLSLVGIFFALTLYSLKRLRWDHGAAASRGTRRMHGALTLLLIANLVAGHLWLQQLDRARMDLTEGQIYSISPATRQYLDHLQEPLLIRGYFSAKTHPLLAPLVPRLRDLIREYQVAGHGNVKAEFIDPQQHPDLEAEANQKYGIKPVPFQVADRYQSALVNSYFQVLVQYGDQYQVLNFRDLIEVKQQGERGIDVELNNPEYKLTSSIKHVLDEFRNGADLYAGLSRPVTLHAYVSADSKLPAVLQQFKQELLSLGQELEQKAAGKLTVQVDDPEAGNGSLAKKLEQDYGFRPLRAGLLDDHRFYFYLTLTDGQQTVQLSLPEDFDKAALQRSIDSGLKRFSGGFLKTVALALPTAPNPYMAQYGMPQDSKQFNVLSQHLSERFNVRQVDLEQGSLPQETDILVVAAPDSLSDKGLFAIDQFLMQGGTVLVATSPYKVSLTRNSLTASTQESPLFDWLKHNGLSMAEELVLDAQNQPFPIPVSRNVGGFNLQELRMIPYPYFIDLRGAGLNPQTPVSAGLSHLMFNWAAPVSVDATMAKDHQVTWLLRSSKESWTSTADNLVPRVTVDGAQGFTPQGERQAHLLGVALQGRFSSYFAGKPYPLLQQDTEKKAAPAGQEQADKAPRISGSIDKSPESARIILYSSADFLSDQTLQLAASVAGSEDLGGLQLLDNSLDWSLEDAGLLTIRGRSHYARTLLPLPQETRMTLEYVNYGIAVIGLLLVFGVYRLAQARRNSRYQRLLEGRA